MISRDKIPYQISNISSFLWSHDQNPKIHVIRGKIPLCLTNDAGIFEESHYSFSNWEFLFSNRENRRVTQLERSKITTKIRIFLESSFNFWKKNNVDQDKGRWTFQKKKLDKLSTLRSTKITDSLLEKWKSWEIKNV